LYFLWHCHRKQTSLSVDSGNWREGRGKDIP
jgi:hypothetical protein